MRIGNEDLDNLVTAVKEGTVTIPQPELQEVESQRWQGRLDDDTMVRLLAILLRRVRGG
jgi:hypothetical protein